MAVEDNRDDNSLREDGPPSEGTVSAGNAVEALTRCELDLPFCSEKMLNLEMFLMQLAGRANDLEVLNMEDEDISENSVQGAFELVVLSGIMDVEVQELQNFMASMEVEIADARSSLPQSEDLEECGSKIEEIEVKLRDAKESVKMLHDSVSEIRKQSNKFEILFFSWSDRGDDLSNGHVANVDKRWSLQTVDQQRHILQTLEKSLARELDLEKKLSDSKANEEKMKLNLHYAERELYYLEESIEICLGRAFETENAAEVLLGISKELASRLHAVQFSLNGSISCEHEMRKSLQETLAKLSAEEAAKEKLKAANAKLEDLLLLKENDLKASMNEVEGKCAVTSSEVSILRKKVTELEDELRESYAQLQLANASVKASQEQQSVLGSELGHMQSVIGGLKADLLKIETKAETAEEKCTELTKTNMELTLELGLLRNSRSEKDNMLEKKLKESDTELELAKASFQAIEEQHNMLYSATVDMQVLIEELKGKVSKAESRAENAETKCNLLTDTNLELNEEVVFLRRRLECLQTSLHQAEDAKVATAKDIGIRTKIIGDLVMKLALERERLQLQISALTKKNKILSKKCRKNNNHITQSCNQTNSVMESPNSSPGALTGALTTDVQDEKSTAAVTESEMGVEATVSTEDSSITYSKSETVRNIEAAQLDWKYIFVAVLVLLISIMTFYMYQR